MEARYLDQTTLNAAGVINNCNPKDSFRNLDLVLGDSSLSFVGTPDTSNR